MGKNLKEKENKSKCDFFDVNNNLYSLYDENDNLKCTFTTNANGHIIKTPYKPHNYTFDYRFDFDDLTIPINQQLKMILRDSIELIYINEKKQEIGIKWTDGTTTKGICQGGDEFDVEIGFLMALKKKIFKSDKKLNEFIFNRLYKDDKQIELFNKYTNKENKNNKGE